MRNFLLKVLVSLVLFLPILSGCSPLNSDNNIISDTSNISETVSQEMPITESSQKETPALAEILQTEGIDEKSKPVNTEPNLLISQPPLLTQCVNESGLTFDALECNQLILVVSDGTAAQVHCYDCIDAQWSLNNNLSYMNGHIGRNGISSNHVEGDGTTPSGFYKLGFAFGINENPGTTLEYRVLTPAHYWVSDPESSYYNQWVDHTDGYDVSKAEHLCAYTHNYTYSIVIEYNMPDVVPYAGSAIFLHCGSMPTSGCVAVSENNMIEILKWLKPNAKILII